MNRTKVYKKYIYVKLQCSICNHISTCLKKHFKHMSKCRRNQFKRKNFPKKFIKQYVCTICKKIFKSHKYLEVHKAKYHVKKVHIGIQKGGNVLNTTSPFKQIKALRGFVRSYRHKISIKTLELYFHRYKKVICSIIYKCLQQLGVLKCQQSMEVKFNRFLTSTEDGEDIFEYQTKTINSNMIIILNNTKSVNRFLRKSFLKIDHIISIFEQYGSGWQMDSIQGCDLKVGIYQPLVAGFYEDLPLYIKNKKAMINIKTKNNICFKYAFLASIHKVSHPERITSYYKFENLYDFSCIKFPVAVKEIHKFEKRNKVSINVFRYHQIHGIIPISISKYNYKDWKNSNLLITSSTSGVSHYVAIRDLNKLLGKRNSHSKSLCYHCLHRFRNCSKNCKNSNCTKTCKLDEHRLRCENFEYQKIVMPKRTDNVKPIIKFENYANQMKIGYCLYADLECILKKVEKSCKNQIIKTREHIPCGFSYLLIREDGKLITHRVYRGFDVVDVFLRDCIAISEIVMEIYNLEVPLIMTKSNNINLKTTNSCFICGKPFLITEKKVKDHNHLTGLYRGAAHQNCNLNFKQKLILPVIMHNFRGYGHHFLIRGLNNIGKQISVIPTNTEKYMSIKVDNICFIDSLQFLPASLFDLVNDLATKSEEHFLILKEIFGTNWKYLIRKGIYPYDYMDDWIKFEENQIPRKQEFYNELTKEHIKEVDYNYAKKVFSIFNLKTMGEYHDLYLLTDSALLACVFEEFRFMCLKYYKLDPAHYFSLPGMVWDAALKMTQIELELLTDIDKYIFFEQGIRGGMAQINVRYAEAHNHYMPSFTGEESDSNQKYICYWDMVNLYGKAMTLKLPVSDFVFLSDDLISSFDTKSLDDTDEFGYVLEVDLEYPDILHEIHQDFPLAVEKTIIPSTMFSSYQKALLKKLPVKYQNQTKLIGHFFIRERYICHYLNLKFYLEKGLKLKKIHRILAFRQKAWLKDYVFFNTIKRAEASSDFEKKFFKLCVNAVFGRAMINVRKWINIKLVNNAFRAKKMMSKCQYLSYDILDENLVAFKMLKSKVILNKAIYTGFAVLELSKLHMSRFHYDVVKNLWGENATLLLTDTDSLAYIIKTADVYEDMQQICQHFDTSNLPSTHLLKSDENKGVLGKMKDEALGQIITKFIGLRTKFYCFLGENEESFFQKMALRGIPKRIQSRSVRFNDLYKTLFQEKVMYCKMNSLRSYKHKVFNITSKKCVSHEFDSKRYILRDGIHTLPFGHVDIKEM